MVLRIGSDGVGLQNIDNGKLTISGGKISCAILGDMYGNFPATVAITNKSTNPVELEGGVFHSGNGEIISGAYKVIEGKTLYQIKQYSSYNKTLARNGVVKTTINEIEPINTKKTINQGDYATFQDLINDCKDEDEIFLNEDISFEDYSYTSERITKKIKIDLNNHTLFVSMGIGINDTGELEIIDTSSEKGGKIVGSGSAYQTIYNGGKLKIRNGSIEMLDNDMAEYYSKNVIDNNGELEIGAISDSEISNETPQINGGAINNGISNYGTVKFYDGKIIGKTAITGGINEIPNSTEKYYNINKTTTDGQEIITIEEETNIIAKINDNGYKSLQSAIDAAEENDEILMQGDYETVNKVLINEGKKIIINLNGNEIKSNNPNTIIENSGELTLKDESEEPSGKITTEGKNLIKNYGKLTLNKGTLVGNLPSPGYMEDANSIIDNFGELIIDEVTIENNQTGINNNIEGTISIKKATFNLIIGGYTPTNAITNNGGEITIEGDININGKNSEMWGESKGIWILSGTVTVKSGTIQSDNVSTIIDNVGTLILGDEDGSVSPTSPAIHGNINNVSTVNFYDGIIFGEIYETTPRTPENYIIETTYNESTGITKNILVLEQTILSVSSISTEGIQPR